MSLLFTRELDQEIYGLNRALPLPFLTVVVVLLRDRVFETDWVKMKLSERNRMVFL